MRRRLATLSDSELDELRSKGRLMRSKGFTWVAIGAKFNVSPDSAHRVCDPEYAASERARHAVTVGHGWREAGTLTGRVDPECVAARLAEIPPDDRTPAQKLMGDPIACRSALATRANNQVRLVTCAARFDGTFLR